MYNLFLPLIFLFVFCDCGFSKFLEIELESGDIIFFDSSEDYMDVEEKTELTKFDLQVLLTEIIAKELRGAEIPSTNKSKENINDIFFKILNTFKYNESVYSLKYVKGANGDDEQLYNTEFFKIFKVDEEK